MSMEGMAVDIVGITVGMIMTIAVGVIVATMSADTKRRRRQAELRYKETYTLRYHQA